MANARSAWGIDIGNRALKAVHLARDSEGVKIDDFEVIEHEHVLSQAGDNREAYIESALVNFVQRHNLKGSAVAVGVSGQSSFARFIKLPPVEPKKIPEIVRFEAIQQIPFPLDDVEWSYQLFQDENSPDVEVGIFAMRKDLVEQHIGYFRQSGIDIEAVQMNPLAVYNAMYHDQRLKGTTMIVDMGAENTDLIIADGETIWLRSIPIGGNAFTEALVKNFKLKFPKAEEMKRNAATSRYGRQILQAMRPVFADLVAEIQRSIGFYSSVHRDSRISKVLALGGTFRLPGLQKYLQQNLQLEMVRIDHLTAGAPGDARMAALFSENILSAVSAYGLALQAMGEGKITSSLLPERIRRERMWREKTWWFGAAAALFLLGTAVPVGNWYYAKVQNQDDVNNNSSHIQTVLTKAQADDREWTAVANNGSDDRKKIADYNALENDHDVMNLLVPTLYGAFIPAVSSDPQQIMKTPRGDRKDVTLDQWRMHYQSDLAPLITMSTEGLILQADALGETGGGGSGGGFDGFGGGHNGGNNSNGAAPAGPDKRGFLVTLRCITPNADGVHYVTDTVIAKLRAQNPDISAASYKIDRVEIVKAGRLGNTQLRGEAARTGMFVPPPPAVNNPTGQFNPGNGGPGGMGPGGRPDFAPGGGGGNNSNDNYPKDPVTGEDMSKDWLVTILVVVELDPPATPATPGQKSLVAER
jgi:type IV pilus assembly protein PilM